jgi:Domain of unknown function (DUF4232)
MTTNMGGDDVRAAGANPDDPDDLSLSFPSGVEPPFRTPVGVLVATARRRGRRRRIATVSAKTAAFAVPVIAAMVVVGNLLPGAVTPAVGPASSPSGATSSPVAKAVGPTSTPGGATSRPVAVCAAAQLSGKQSSRTGAAMSNTFAEIILTNGGPGSCQLSGYPHLTVWGTVPSPTGSGPSALLETAVTRGSTMLMPDPGPTTVVIHPGGQAWFGVGAGTGYPSPLVAFDKFVIDLGSAAGGRASHVDVAVGMGANGPPGKAIPVTVTAFAPGVPPKP